MEHWWIEEIWYSECSQAVPARPSGIKVVKAEINLNYKDPVRTAQ